MNASVHSGVGPHGAERRFNTRGGTRNPRAGDLKMAAVYGLVPGKGGMSKDGKRQSRAISSPALRMIFRVGVLSRLPWYIPVVEAMGLEHICLGFPLPSQNVISY